GRQNRQQQTRQREMPQMVGTELALKAVLREPSRGRHDAGVVDKQVDAITRARQRRREIAYRREVREVEALHSSTRAIKALQRALPFARAPAGEHALRARPRQLTRCPQPEPAVGAGDDRRAPALIRYVSRGPVRHQPAVLRATDSEYAPCR